MVKKLEKKDRRRVTVHCGKTEKNKGRTQQQFKEQCDINAIMKKYERTGVLDHMRNEVQGEFGDFSDVPSYQESLNQVINAHEAFDSLPPRVKREFGYDPLKMVAFCADEKNLERARELGLAKPLQKDESSPIGSVTPDEAPIPTKEDGKSK